MNEHSPLTKRLIREGLAQPAYIEGGPELDRALNSLGLKRPDAPKSRLFGKIIRCGIFALSCVGFAVFVYGFASFVLWVHDKVAPIQVAG